MEPLRVPFVVFILISSTHCITTEVGATMSVVLRIAEGGLFLMMRPMVCMVCTHRQHRQHYTIGIHVEEATLTTLMQQTFPKPMSSASRPAIIPVLSFFIIQATLCNKCTLMRTERGNTTACTQCTV